MSLENKTVLITGAARRLGQAFSFAVAQAGADVIIHYGHSSGEAEETAAKIRAMGRQSWIVQADLGDPQSASRLVERAWQLRPFDAVVNSAAIFEALDWQTTTLDDWQRHLAVNLTAPFLISQAFGRKLGTKNPGRIVNILDWRALHPGSDHLPYTITKAGLAALTQSLAQALAPGILVNGLALGAILPPTDGADAGKILKKVPAGRWAGTDEVNKALLFLLDGPDYITGEILHVDGGRHLI